MLLGCTHSKFWKHIDYCTKLLNSIIKEDETDSSKKYHKRIGTALKLLTTSYMSVREWEGRTSDLDTPVAERVSLGGAVLYIFEGIIPLVTAFCVELDKLSSSGPACRIYARLLERKDIAKSLWNFASSFKV